ncbi:MAG: SCO family protein [Pseudomonadota bacterium]
MNHLRLRAANTISRRLVRYALATLLALPLLCGAGAPAALPADSLYRLAVPLTDSVGKQFDWSEMAGHAVLVTMFYGDCNTACPIVLENLQQTVAALKLPAARLSVLMVSLDPLRDTPKSLAKLAQSHHLDPALFRMAVSSDDTHTRALAAALRIKYRGLAGGEINHTTRICLLDANGKVVASSTELSTVPDAAFLAQLKAALQ